MFSAESQSTDEVTVKERRREFMVTRPSNHIS